MKQCVTRDEGGPRAPRRNSQAGGQDDHLAGENGQLPALGTAGLADDTDDVAPSQQVVDLHELAGGVRGGIGHHLHLAAVAAEVVKHQLLPAPALAPNAPGDGHNGAAAC